MTFNFKNSYLAVQGSSKKKGNHLTDDGENEERKMVPIWSVQGRKTQLDKS